MEKTTLICAVLMFVADVFGLQQGGGVLFCQHTWENGSTVKLTFALSESRFPSQCTSTNRQPYFQKKTYGCQNKVINCTVSDITAPGACSGSFRSGSLGCGCTGTEGGYYVMEYNFIAHPDYNGWWSAAITCLDSSPNQVLSFAKLDCDNKQVESAVGFPRGGFLVCQPTWVIGAAVKLTLAIDKSRFPSLCSLTDNQPYFLKTTNRSLIPRENCTVSDITAPGACNGSFQSGSLGCGCTAKEGGYYVVEYNFIAHPDYNGWWSASVICRDEAANEVLSYSTLDCENKTVQPAPTTSTTPGAQEDSDNHSTAHSEREDSDKHDTTHGDKNKSADTSAESNSPSTLIIGLGVAGGLCVVMATVGAGVNRYRKRRAGSQHNPPPDNALQPDNSDQIAGRAGPSTREVVPRTTGAQPDEASEGTDFSASEVSDV